MSEAILLLSGGMDSTVVLAKLFDEGVAPICLIFDYGQTLGSEISVARANAINYGCEYFVKKIRFDDLFNCALFSTSHQQLPQNRTLEEIRLDATPTSYVPFRNGVFLAYAIALGEALDIERILTGGNGLASGNYWDDTSQFALAMQGAGIIGTHPSYTPSIEFPLAFDTKNIVAQKGKTLNVDFSLTWSCYLNGKWHCERCDSCVQREAALAEIGLDIHGYGKEMECI